MVLSYDSFCGITFMIHFSCIMMRACVHDATEKGEASNELTKNRNIKETGASQPAEQTDNHSDILRTTRRSRFNAYLHFGCIFPSGSSRSFNESTNELCMGCWSRWVFDEKRVFPLPPLSKI